MTEVEEREEAMERFNKLVSMMRGDQEMKNLSLRILKEEYPSIWAAYMNMVGITQDITPQLLIYLGTIPDINIGTIVKYRGLSGPPEMIVVAGEVKALNPGSHVNLGNTLTTQSQRYCVMLKCKYFNKSKQEFCIVEDRSECFEIVSQIKKQEKHELREVVAGHDIQNAL